MGSSIGRIGSDPELASAERLRTIVPGVLDRVGLDVFTETFRRYTDSIDDTGPATRLTLRLVADDRIVSELPGREAVIALGTGRSLVYVGANAPSRALRDGERLRLDEVRDAAVKNHGADDGPNFEKILQRLERARAVGYAVTIAQRESERETLARSGAAQLSALLARFGYTQSDTLAIVREPSNLIGTVSREGQIVAVVVAEQAEVPLATASAVLRIAELTDSSVADEHVGFGLQLVLHVHLIAALVRAEVAPDLIFSESGYTASLFNAATLGRRFAGRLPNHAIINGADPANATRYESLEVTTLLAPQAAALVAALLETGAI